MVGCGRTDGGFGRHRWGAMEGLMGAVEGTGGGLWKD